MTLVRFILVSAQGRQVMEFDSPSKAREWATKRQETAKGSIPKLTLIKQTTTTVKKVIDYV